MKLLKVIFITLVLHSCNSRISSEQINIKKNNEICFQYPRIIDSLKLTDLYDSARWFIYTWHCDMPYLPKTDSLRIGSFGELELKFNRVLFKKDTVEIDFYFMDKGESVLTGSTRDTRELATGVRFDFEAKRKLAMFSHNGYSFQTSGGKNRYENPLQPEVIKYIKENWDKLNECFRELAERKGIKK